MRQHHYYCYIAASLSRVLYVGVTNSLFHRMLEHKAGRGGSFTSKYNVNRLVWYAGFQQIAEAIAEEKRLKGWRRSRKLDLIDAFNPAWDDLSPREF